MPPNGKKLFTLKGQLRPPQSLALDPLLIISSKIWPFPMKSQLMILGIKRPDFQVSRYCMMSSKRAAENRCTVQCCPKCVLMRQCSDALSTIKECSYPYVSVDSRKDIIIYLFCQIALY